MFAWLQSLFARLSPGYARHIDPPVTACEDRPSGFVAAATLANSVGGTVAITSGTPSMVPLIPAAPTWLAVKPTPFAEIKLGTVAVYRAAWLNGQQVCHRLVAKGDATGYIPSGDNNRYSENLAYVRESNYVGEVIGIFTFPNELTPT